MLKITKLFLSSYFLPDVLDRRQPSVDYKKQPILKIKKVAKSTLY